MSFAPTRLSQETFDKFKAASLKEYGDTMTDEEIEDMGARLLQLYQLLASEPEPAQPEPVYPNETESLALVYLKAKLGGGHSPSVRELSHALEFKSSRSGHRMLQNLIDKGWVTRDASGKLTVANRWK